MKLLFLCKRRPQGRDLFSQPYGRFYHLPRHLSERSHVVYLLLLSYRNESPVYRREGNLHIHGVSALPWGPWPYLGKAGELCDTLHPDWVSGFSDIWYGILAQRLASARGTKCLIDAYDNYESYLPWASPLHWLWRRALAQADVVTAAGPQLADWMRTTSGRAAVEVVPMAADPLFQPLDKPQCRQRLGLPLHGRLLGYAGALHPSRGIGLLFEVFARLRQTDPDVGLVLSGRLAKGVELPKGVHWLGYRPPREVPLILNSLDLQFIINKPGAFGNFSYPAKLYEAMACGIPVVAADLPGTAWILREYPEMLAKTGDVGDFVLKAKDILSRGRIRYPRVSVWDESAAQFEKLFCTS